MLQEYLSYALSETNNNISAAPVVLVMETLYQCNVEEQIIPEHLFYNNSVAKYGNLSVEWSKFTAIDTSSQVFNFWSYPFLIPDTIKYAVLLNDFKNRSKLQVRM